MGQLAPARFKTNHKASGGLYAGQGYVDIANNKIKDKREFILGTNAQGRKVYGLRLIVDKDKFFLEYANSKTSKVKTGQDLISRFFKDPDFGGGRGSGGGADDTAVTESMQCFYLSLLFNTSVNKLDNKNAQLKNLETQKNNCYVYERSTRLTAKDCYDRCPEDWFEKNVFIKTANAIYQSQYSKPFKGKKVYFHRGSPFMKKVYASKKRAMDFDRKNNNPPIAPGSFSDDKWNPGDIWMSTQMPTAIEPFVDNKKFKKPPVEWTTLREAVVDKSTINTIGVSLKKVEGNPSVVAFNTRERTHNKEVRFSGFTFGQTGDFFKSADMYMYFSDGGIMQLRATATTKSWQGEMKGKYAAAGKIGGGNINHFVEQVYGKSIGSSSMQSNWNETYYTDSNLSIMYNLYKKYINKQKSGIPKQNVVSQAEFKRLADGYKNNKGQPASPAFYFGKYMALLFLDTIKADTKNRQLDDFSKSIVRYAMSNTDISTFFIKVS